MMKPAEVVHLLEQMEEREGRVSGGGDAVATEALRSYRRQEALRAAISAVRTVTARTCTTTFPEPPRDSGEADAVNGLTALRTHQDNTHTQGEVGPGTRP